jgi:gluconokinase
MVIVLMGVSGSGKTTVGERLAEALGGQFFEGDAYHPPANVEKMHAGTPLDDADREPWLAILSREIGHWLDEGTTAILACSALKQSYRDVLKAGRAGVHFVHLDGDEALIRRRLGQRQGHYMPPSLLASQLATLESPGDALTIDIGQSPAAIVAHVLEAIAALESKVE